MVEERTTQMSQSASSSTPTPIVEENILDQVLGVRRGHRKGVGPIVPSKDRASASSSSSQSDSATAASLPPQAIEYMSKLFNQQQQMYQALREMNPNFRLDEMLQSPATVFGVPSTPAADPEQHQDDEDHDDDDDVDL